jgi:Sulfotransferase domain
VRVIDRHTIDRRIREALPVASYDSLKGVYYGARALVRRNPGRGRLLPDFLIVGSTKCGTTSLHGWLVDHPLVADTNKEIHFFNMNYHRRADWYRCYFPYASERDAFAAEHGRPFISGEATASYLAHYWTPQRAAKLVPNARLIVCLRDPADRAYSQYHYFRRRRSEPLESFEEAIASEQERLRGEEEREIGDPRYHSWRVFRWGYLRTSRYAEHLERWLDVFPREQFLFLKFEDVVAAPERALEQIHEHLGLPPHRNGDLPRLNAGSYEPMAQETRARLQDYFRPHNERLRELTGIDFGWS